MPSDQIFLKLLDRVTTLIHAKNLSIIRNKKKILEKIDLEIKNNDFITIVGPNGAGKSMLLKVLLGVEQISSGEVKTKSNLSMAYVPQDFVTENILPINVRQFLQLNNNANHADIEAVASETKTQNLLERQIYALSGGERQRVLLARALIKQPELIVLDEPAQNLDLNSQQKFYSLIQSIYQNHSISILMVSHELHFVMACSRQVICLYHHICCSGSPQNVVKDPEFIKIFGTNMVNLMAVYQHDHDHSHTQDHVTDS